MLEVINKMKALGDRNRFRISMMLLHRPMCVCEMLEILDIAGGTLSNHLKILKNAGLIGQRKEGKWIEYYISNKEAELLLSSIESYIVDKTQITGDRKSSSSITRAVCSSTVH